MLTINSFQALAFRINEIFIQRINVGYKGNINNMSLWG